MNEKKGRSDKPRTILVLTVGAAVVVTFLILTATLWIKGKMPDALLGLGISAVVIGLFIWFLKKETRRMKEKLPREDEMSNRIKQRAGYYTFLAMIWFALGFSWYISFAEDYGWPVPITRHALSAVIAFGGLLFMGLWWYFDRKGEA